MTIKFTSEGANEQEACATIHSNCLLPAPSDGGLKLLVTSFECIDLCRFTAPAMLRAGEKKFIVGAERNQPKTVLDFHTRPAADVDGVVPARSAMLGAR
jgi:hypothetical protein